VVLETPELSDEQMKVLSAEFDEYAGSHCGHGCATRSRLRFPLPSGRTRQSASLPHLYAIFPFDPHPGTDHDDANAAEASASPSSETSSSRI